MDESWIIQAGVLLIATILFWVVRYLFGVKLNKYILRSLPQEKYSFMYAFKHPIKLLISEAIFSKIKGSNIFSCFGQHVKFTLVTLLIDIVCILSNVVFKYSNNPLLYFNTSLIAVVCLVVVVFSELIIWVFFMCVADNNALENALHPKAEKLRGKHSEPGSSIQIKSKHL